MLDAKKFSNLADEGVRCEPLSVNREAVDAHAAVDNAAADRRQELNRIMFEVLAG
jgi:hypothetical protein